MFFFIIMKWGKSLLSSVLSKNMSLSVMKDKEKSDVLDCVILFSIEYSHSTRYICTCVYIVNDDDLITIHICTFSLVYTI